MSGNEVAAVAQERPSLTLTQKVTEEKKNPLNEQVLQRAYDLLDEIEEAGADQVMIRQVVIQYERAGGKETTLAYYNWDGNL